MATIEYLPDGSIKITSLVPEEIIISKHPAITVTELEPPIVVDPEPEIPEDPILSDSTELNVYSVNDGLLIDRYIHRLGDKSDLSFCPIGLSSESEELELLKYRLAKTDTDETIVDGIGYVCNTSIFNYLPIGTELDLYLWSSTTERHFRRFVVVLDRIYKPSDPDVQYIKTTNGWLDKPLTHRRVLIEVTAPYLAAVNWSKDIKDIDVQIVGSLQGQLFIAGGCSDIRFDCSNLKVNAAPDVTALHIKPSEHIGNSKYPGMTPTENISIYGLKNIVGGHGINIEPGEPTATKKTLGRYTFYDCHVAKSAWEAYYMGYTKAGMMEIEELVMAYCSANECGNDFLQPGSVIKMDIHNCYGVEAGRNDTKNQHGSSISMNQNNGGAIYRSTFLNGNMPYTGTFGPAGRDIILAHNDFDTAKPGHWPTAMCWHRVEKTTNVPMLAVVGNTFKGVENKMPMDFVCHDCEGSKMVVFWEGNESMFDGREQDMSKTGVKPESIPREEMILRLLKMFPAHQVNLLLDYDNEGYIKKPQLNRLRFLINSSSLLDIKL